MVRVTLAGPALRGLTIDAPAASVRVLLPEPGASELVLPEWQGNEYRGPDGRRPTIRTFTPRRLRAASDPDPELDVDVVVHGQGAASTWADGARPGSPAAVSGPGRGYEVDPDARAYVLAGDETALPAIAQLLEVLPGTARVDVHVEVADPVARLDLPAHPGATVTWHDLPPGAAPGTTLVDAVAAAAPGFDPDVRVWGAGEAAAVQRLRRLLIDGHGIPRGATWLRGYWQRGRRGE